MASRRPRRDWCTFYGPDKYGNERPCLRKTTSKTGLCPEHRPRARKGSTPEKAACGTPEDSGSIPDESTLVALEDALDKIEELEAKLTCLETELMMYKGTPTWTPVKTGVTNISTPLTWNASTSGPVT